METFLYLINFMLACFIPWYAKKVPSEDSEASRDEDCDLEQYFEPTKENAKEESSLALVKASEPVRSRKELSEDLWINVATFLDPQSLSAVTCVNRSWCTLSHDSTFWRVVTAEQLQYQLSEAVVDSLMSCEDWTLIHSLDLSGTDISDAGLCLIAKALSEIETVNLEGCGSITDAGVMQFAKRTARSLVTIDLSETRTTDRSLRALARFCQELQSVSCKNCDITDQGLESLAKSAAVSRLRSLEFGGCAQVTDNGLRHMARCENLESVMIMGCDVTDTGISHLSECASLQRLAACGFPGPITNKSATALAQCKNLTDLILPASEITDAGLRTLAFGCPQLEHVFLADTSEITDRGLTSLAAHCANLQSVDTSGCEKVMSALPHIGTTVMA